MLSTVDMLHTFNMPNLIEVLSDIHMLSISMVTIVDTFDIITVIINAFNSTYLASTCGVVLQLLNGPVVAIRAEI